MLYSYADPEHYPQKVSEKSDVYSYGVVLLELISGKKTKFEDTNIVAWIVRALEGYMRIEEIWNEKNDNIFLKDNPKSNGSHNVEPNGSHKSKPLISSEANGSHNIEFNGSQKLKSLVSSEANNGIEQNEFTHREPLVAINGSSNATNVTERLQSMDVKSFLQILKLLVTPLDVWLLNILLLVSSPRTTVYSYGVMLMEMITGKEAFDDIVEWGVPQLERALSNGNYDFVDKRLKEYNKNEMNRMIACALACLRNNPQDRPEMRQIVEVLKGNIDMHDLLKREQQLTKQVELTFGMESLPKPKIMAS
ncbi:hypothetical protein GH714_009365 [Hevea brasiliensis]|uniref:non-specific serine/threonine protein kinase n=1 Tax=Hevea brasiliensis TaxID=3981 RepID=A0A6A6KZ38_HEVBR|nr:hypothetical protein GH714_009365 [Hevea brasiliensis]